MPRRKHSNGAIAAYPANAAVAMAASTTSNCGFRRILGNRADSAAGRERAFWTQRLRRQGELASAQRQRQLEMRELAAAVAPATAATVATVAAAEAGALAGFVDSQRAAAEVLAVQSLDCLVGVGVSHFDEAEAPRAASIAVLR